MSPRAPEGRAQFTARRGAAQFDALPPQAYRSFVAAHGYPLLAVPAELHYGFAFPPPLAARQVSRPIADEDRDFAEVRAARRA
ncbi:MAG: hypothetical protein ACN6RH_11810 [Stenotrophomonas rhizophila]|uniref:hypothetical protein n=1 Tax=Stenotrophomonas rhizophila TaxID=216778 RepID=UPI003D1218F5